MRRSRAHTVERCLLANRRSGAIPGRRFALTVGVLAIALGLAPAPASADQVVLNATVFPGAGGAISNSQITLGELQGCEPYDGPNPMYFHPSGLPEAFPPDATWSLGEVLGCRLDLNSVNVSTVQVLKSPAYLGAETLTTAEVFDSSQYQEAQDELPVVFADGDQNSYFRPWLGGADDNASDFVIAQGAPISILVYENGVPLTVNIAASTVSQTTSGANVQLSATVQNAGGQPIPATALTWNWSFDDGTTSTVAAPLHAFAPGGYPVTVQVTDSAAGSGGTATIDVAVQASPAPGSHAQSGGGGPRKTGSPTGPDRSRGKQPGARPGSSAAHHSSPSGAAPRQSGSTQQPASHNSTTSHTTSNPPPTTTEQTTASTSTTASTPAATTTTAPSVSTTSSSPPPPRHAPTRARRPHPARTRTTARVSGSAVPLISGRLISDVALLPPDESPLVQPVTAAQPSAPAVRRAVAASSLPPLAGVLVAIAIFALGAQRELRGRRRRRPEW